MAAGNDDNDLDMLKKAVGLKLVVGDSLKGKIRSTKNVIYLPTPKDLGKYLQGM